MIIKLLCQHVKQNALEIQLDMHAALKSRLIEEASFYQHVS